MISGQVIYLRRGQLAVSERYLAEKANWGRKAIRVFLERLQAFEMITISAGTNHNQLSLSFSELRNPGTKKGPPLSVITICNYDKFQTAAPPRGPARAQEGPSRGPAGAQNLTTIQGEQQNKVVRLAGAAESGSQAPAYAHMIDTLAGWISPLNPDKEAAEKVLAGNVALYTMPVVRDAIAEMSTEIAAKGTIGRPLQVFTKACQRIQARGGGFGSTKSQSKAERAKKFIQEAFGEEDDNG